MLIAIPQLFSKEQVKAIRNVIDNTKWIDGNETSGTQAALAKKNKQLPLASGIRDEIGNQILDALGANPLFLSAALPLKILPPLFNKYEVGDGFDIHVDNAIRPIHGTHHRIRTDLSMTIFFSEPEEYDGGELIIETNFGAQSVKLAAGDAILYPSTSLHKVSEITRGARVSSFFWIQSMVKDENERTILFDLDQSIQRLSMEKSPKDQEVVRLTGIYHNLIRRFADA
jgi:PKHD-type hydroxylase